MQTLSTRKTQSWLSWFARGILLLGTLFLIGRLFELQVIKGAYYRDLADGNRIRRVPIFAPRGKILAKNGEILATNKEINKAIVFSPVTGYEKKDIYNPNEDVEIIIESVRYYPLADITAHITGYVGMIGATELGKTNPNCIDKGIQNGETFVGRTGLEEQYDCQLRGIDGEMLIEVDTTGKTIRLLAKKNPIAGVDIRTTLDVGLQKKVAEEMRDKQGAVIATGKEGEVLAMYSSPSYDPNLFIDDNTDKLELVLTDSRLPLFNRAISGVYHPGSIFKPVVAIAALETDKIDENFTFDDTGSIVINDYSYSNWYFTQYGQTEGNINLIRAIARSTDTFFYKVGEVLGVDNLAHWAKKFKLAESSGIDLPGENSGLVPDPAWKLRVKSEPWYLGNTYHMSIGQGDLLVTPIAINSAISTIAYDGKYCQPHLKADKNCVNFELQQENLDQVKRGMISACQTGGTGYTFFESDPLVACKTGTAETVKKDVTHAWFTFFAPAGISENGTVKSFSNPEIVTTVLVEEGGEGSKVAGPIAREVFNYWFGVGKKTSIEDWPQ